MRLVLQVGKIINSIQPLPQKRTQKQLSPSSPASNPTSSASEGVSGKSMTGFAEAQPEHPRGSTEGEGQS